MCECNAMHVCVCISNNGCSNCYWMSWPSKTGGDGKNDNTYHFIVLWTIWMNKWTNEYIHTYILMYVRTCIRMYILYVTRPIHDTLDYWPKSTYETLKEAENSTNVCSITWNPLSRRYPSTWSVPTRPPALLSTSSINTEELLFKPDSTSDFAQDNPAIPAPTMTMSTSFFSITVMESFVSVDVTFKYIWMCIRI